MAIIRQEIFFSIQELYDMASTQKYAAIIAGIDLDMIYHAVKKQSRYSAPESVNHPATITAYFILFVERIPTIKDLAGRLKNDVAFRMDCGFRVNDPVPSQATFSRLTTKLSDTNILGQPQASVTRQATDEGFISDDTVALDATHVDARNQAPTEKVVKSKPAPKKRGCKSKDERDQCLKAEAEKAANLPLYEKPIAAQLDVTLADLRQAVPQDPKWGTKKNSEAKTSSGMASRRIWQWVHPANILFSGCQLNDGKAAIPLIKVLNECVSLPYLRYQTMSAGYDYTPIYTQVHQMGQQSVIAYNRRNEPEAHGFNKSFAPTCVREHTYCYDSFDTKYETLKYTQPKECKDCPLLNEGVCQKVWKIKITKDFRRYTAPARGSKAWNTIFKRRTAVERVNAYLKEYFQLNNVRYRTGHRAKVHFDTVALVYNASNLARDRINAQLNTQNVA